MVGIIEEEYVELSQLVVSSSLVGGEGFLKRFCDHVARRKLRHRRSLVKGVESRLGSDAYESRELSVLTDRQKTETTRTTDGTHASLFFLYVLTLPRGLRKVAREPS